MKDWLRRDLLGRFWIVTVPRTDDNKDGVWQVTCYIDIVTDFNVSVYCTCLDWLSETFELPIPARIGTLYESIRIVVYAMVARARIEYLCS